MAKKSKLIIISQYFYPELISTGQLLTELAEQLTNDGLSVKVFCGQPTYYSQNKVDRIISYNGISIIRVSNFQFNKNSFFGKIANSLSFFFLILVKLLFFKFQPSTKLLIVTNPPFLPFIGFILQLIKKTPYILLIHDVYPDIAIKLGYFHENSTLTQVWRKISFFVNKNSEKIIVLGRDMAEVISRQISDKNKIAVIENWADGRVIQPVAKQDNSFIINHNLQNKFIVLYSGNMGLFHDMESIIQSAALLRNFHDIIFVFIGGGGKFNLIKKYVNDNKLSNVFFYEYQSKDFLKFTLSSADVSLISLENGVQGLAVPCKLYGIMASGKPIVANVPETSEIALVLRESRCGTQVPVKQPQAIANAILEYYNNKHLRYEHGNNARLEFERKYTLEIISKKYRELLCK